MKLILRSFLLVFFIVCNQLGWAQKLYWVGGSGNFNDPAHWSLESGGTGGAQSPAASNDVYFDENSFLGKSVITLVGNPQVHDLIFSDYTQPLILSGTQNEKLTISGNARFNPYVDNQFLGDVWFSSTSSQEIPTPALFIGNVYFDGGGTWNINAIFNVAKKKSLIIKSGSIVVNDKLLFIGNISVQSLGNLLLNNSKILIDNLITISNSSQIKGDSRSSLLFNYSKNTTKFIGISTQNTSNLRPETSPTTINPIPPTCHNDCDAQITVTNITGTAPYTLVFQGSTIQTYTTNATTFLVTNLCPDVYNVVVSDSSGAPIGSTSANVPNKAQISLVAVKTFTLSCFSQCTGSFVYYVFGGNPNYNISWSPGPITRTNFSPNVNDTLKNLCSGTYTPTVTDTKGCTLPATTINISGPTQLVTHGNTKAPTCFGICDGKVWVAPTGGTAFGAAQANGIKYTTVWDGNAALSNDTIYNLCGGTTHTCVVTDKNGCTASYTVTIPAAPTAITFTQTNNSPLSCNNICNGVIGVTGVTGGTPTYAYTWAPAGHTIGGAGTNSSYSNLCAGTYTCTIKDINLCAVTATFTVVSPPAITHTITGTNPKCNGQLNGSIKDTVTGGTPPYVIPFSWSTVGTVTNTASSSTNSGIGAGTYTAIVTDNKGCKDTAKATLTDPPVLTGSLTPTNPACFGSTNGQICAVPNGGTGADTYSWTPAEPATACITGLGQGGYTVVISDANNCKITLNTTLVSPPILTIGVVKVDPTCFGVPNGSATVTASGGSGSGYTYSWSCAPGNASTVLTGQSGGSSCTVTVTDGTCSKSQVINFIDPNPLLVSLSATALTCANQCNAQISSSIIGGTPTYTYTWSGTGTNPVTPGLPFQSGMCAGSYSLTISDANNCVASASVAIANPPPIVITATPTKASCSGTCDGSINAGITGGQGPYTYTWSPVINPLSLTPNHLCPGSYTLSVTDVNNCTASKVVTIINPTAVADSITKTNVTCAGQCNGTGSAIASGGTTPYTYSWDGAGYTASNTIGALCAGSHTLDVKDSGGCAALTQIFIISQPSALTAAVSNVTKSCLNKCNGTATAVASGGTGPYTYSWDASAGPFSGSTTTNTLCIGTHTLYIQDANNCIASTTFNVQVIINVNIIASALSVSCNGACDGSASATAAGGSGPYTFSWSGGGPTCTLATSCTASGLCPGIYSVTVMDQTFCASEDTVVISNPPVLSASISTTNATCFGTCNGSATVTPSGGTAPYTITWSNNGSVGPILTNLCPGSYTATIKDSKGCTVIQPITITSLPQYTVTPTITPPSSCITSDGSVSLAISGAGGSYTLNWSNPPGGSSNPLTNVAAGIYTVTINDVNGCDTVIAIGVNNLTGPTTSVTFQNASCYNSCDGSATVSGTGVPPINVIWTSGTPSGASPQSASGLCAGTYPVKVTDGNSCTSIASVVIGQPTVIVPNAVVHPLTCSSGNTGSITFTPTGGTGGYTYTLNGVSVGGSPITNLAAGTYTVVITDNTNCSVTGIYTINAPSALVINVVKTDELCVGSCNGTAKVTVVGSTPGYTVQWQSPSGAALPPTPNVAGLCPGTYTLTINDINGCSGQSTVIINPANAILSNFVKHNDLCTLSCTGSAAVVPTGGSGGSFTYYWNTVPNSTSSSVNSLCPGNYYVIATDTNHCNDTTRFTIAQPTAVNPGVTFTNPTCFGLLNGTASTNATGGAGGTYTYSWNPIISSSASVSNLGGTPPNNNYVVTVTDSNGCISSQAFTLTSPTKLNANAVGTNPLCNNNCNGSINAGTTGGTTPPTYNYQWLGTAIGNVSSASNLCAGSYTLVVSDANNCTDTAKVSLTNPPPLQLNISSSPALCGQSNGALTISNISGNGTVTVTWLNPVSCGSGSTCSNLSAGVYSVSLTDANACKDTFAVGLTNSNSPIVNLTTTNITCFGSCNGTASVTASGGTPGTTGYTYGWNTTPANASTTTSVNGLCASANDISTVTDSLLCKAVTTFTITSPTQISSSPNITNATCAGINNGAIAISASGGTPFITGYLYQINNGGFASTNSFTSLAVGSYTVDVKDSLGCIQTFTYAIGGSTFILSNVSATNINCFGVCNGTATLSNINGGTTPYAIVWNDALAQTQPVATNLCAGSYTAVITDHQGCQASQVATVTGPSAAISTTYSVTQPACGLCNGAITLATPTGGTGPSYTYSWSPQPSASPSITNVCAAVYQVDITDAVGCKTSYSIPVSSSNSPTVTATPTGVSCFGKCDGSASTNVTGGIAPYTYNWVGLGNSTPSVSNLCADTVFVQVKDAASCVQTQSVVITTPTQIVSNQTITPTPCGKCIGAVAVAPSGGNNSSYSYTWNGAASTLPQTNLCAGSYTLVIKDGSGCTDTSLIGLNSTNGPSVNVAVTDPTCFNASNGSALATITGGVTPYTLTWSNNSSANPLTAINAGNYDITVKDDSGCVTVQTFTLTDPTQLALSLNNTQLPSCGNACNGALTALPTGGSLPYTYSWSNGVSTDTITHLCTGTYTLNVTDNHNCMASQVSTLINNPYLISANPLIVSPSCDSCNGSITLQPSGGTLPYTYTWNNPPSSNIQVTNICAGIYQVDIKDGLGCTQSVQIPISNLGAPSPTVTVTDPTCYGLSNGSATVTATGGVTPYTYSWPSIPATTAIVNNLSTQIYFVQVKDSLGCIATQSVSVAPANTPVFPNITTISPACGLCNGVINTSASGGAGGYSYTWLPGNLSTPNIGPVCAQNYTLVITDGNACKDTFLVGLNSSSGPALNITATAEACYGQSSATATVSATGGLQPYQYIWTNGQTDSIATTLSAINYAVQVTDAANCVQTASVSITQPTKLILSDPTIVTIDCYNNCNGSINTVVSGGTPNYIYSWSSATAVGPNPTALCANNYTLTVTDANNCLVVEIDTLKNPTLLAVTGTFTNSTCNNVANGAITTTPSGGTPNYTYQWSGSSTAVTQNLPAILPGNYTITVTDSRSCKADTNFTVLSTVSVTVNAGNDTVSCNKSAIILSGTVTVVGTPSYTFNWQDASGNIASTLTVSVHPSTGTTSYTLTANAGGCTDSDTINISISPPATANAGPDISILGGLSTNIGGNPVNPSGGTINWQPNIAISDTSASNPVVTPSVTTSYIVYVTNTFGCVASDTMIVTVLPPFDIPNGFTPNGDGKNDTWVIDYMYKFPNAEVEIYNRWGEQLFYSKGNYIPWNGTYKGEPLPVGTYYYIIRLHDAKYADHYTSPLTILR